MAPSERHPSRRQFLQRSAALGGGLAASMLAHPSAALAGPATSVARNLRVAAERRGRPSITHGVQSGDVTTRSAVVWARADRPSRMTVEIAGSESFRNPRPFLGGRATEDTDYTAQLDLKGLPSGEEVFYRVASRASMIPAP